MALNLLIGPAGGGKSQLAERAVEPGDVLIDFGRLSAALFPADAGQERRDSMLPFLAAVRTFAVRAAAERGLSGLVTFSDGRRETIQRWQGETGGEVYVMDPGEEVVRRRLGRSQRGREAACDVAMARWYDNYQPDDGDHNATDLD